MYRLRLTTLGLATVVLAGSCVADNVGGSMIVLGNRSPASDCTIDGSEQGAFNSRLRYDLSATLPNGQINEGLTAHGIVKSLLIDSETLQRTVTPASQAHVEIVATNTTPSQDLVAALGALAIFDPQASGGPVAAGGTAAWSVEVISAVMRDNIAANFPAGEDSIDVEAQITLKGVVNGGTVDADLWRLPISIYRGGLLIGLDGSCCNVVTAAVATCEPFETGTRCCTHPAGGSICPSVLPQTGCM